MKKFFEGKSPISFGNLLLTPGYNEVPEELFSHTVKRSMYIRTLVNKGLIRDSEAVEETAEGKSEEYVLGEMVFQDATRKVEKTTDATLLQQWLVQEKARKSSRKSVVEAIEDQLKTLES